MPWQSCLGVPDGRRRSLVSLPAGRRRLARSVVAVVCTALYGVGLAVMAVPAGAEPVTPSQQQVDAANHVVQQRATQVASLQNRLDALALQLRQLEVAAAQATEAYNFARDVLTKAEADEAAARSASEAANRRAEEARDRLGRLAAATYRSGGELATVNLVLSAENERQLFDGAAAMQKITGGYDEVYAEFRAAREQAEVAAVAAREALQAHESAAAQAEASRAEAEKEARAGQQWIDAVNSERRKLVTEIAATQQTSVELEQARQDGLAREADEQARREAEERARQEAERRAAQEVTAAAAREAAARATRTTAAAGNAATAAAPQPAAPAPVPPAPNPPPAPEPPLAPKPPASPPPPAGGGDSSAGAAAAIAFARAQIGKPYVLGAEGPDAYDCSGLTLRAWQSGGVSLPRSSRQQWTATQRLSYDSLRPGDLIFWATDSSNPSSIYHVALYIGGGRMIHAPNPSRPVEERGVFYMGTPIGYGRV